MLTYEKRFIFLRCRVILNADGLHRLIEMDHSVLILHTQSHGAYYYSTVVGTAVVTRKMWRKYETTARYTSR